MNIKDSYIHNGTAVLKDVKVENSVLKKILAGKDANDAYLDWETVCDLTGIKPKAAGTADKVEHKLTFSGGVTGTWDGSADKTVTIPTKSSWNYDDVYLKLTGNGTINPLTGTIYIKDVNGIILNSKDKDLNIWEVYGNSGAWTSQYGFNLQYTGTGSGNNNDLILWAHNQNGTHVESYRVKQDGTFIFKAVPKVGTNIMYHAGNLTIKTLMGSTAIGDSDEPVYWNGNSFVKAGAYPTKASWNYDDVYLKLSGGTLTGKLTIKTNGFGNQLTLDRGSDSGSWGPGIMFYDNGTFLACLGVDTSGTLYKGDNGSTKYAIYHAGNLTASVISGLGTLSNNISGNAATATKANSIVTERGTNNAYRNVFFAYDGDNTRVVYDDDFMYNPSTNTLKIGTGTITATNYSGNAATATAATTATTATKIGTSTVGSSTMPVYINSGAPAAITSFPEAYLSWGGKNFAGSYGPIDAAMISDLGACRSMFAKAAGITVQYSRDGGSTWVDYGLTDTQKTALFSVGQGIVIGGTTETGIDKSNYKSRVIVTTNLADIYTSLNKIAVYLSTNGSSGCNVTIDARTKANVDAGNDTWVTLANAVPVNGWSGWNIINIPSTTTYGNTSAQYQQIRFTFGVTSHASTSAYSGLSVSKIMMFGGVGWVAPSNMAKNGHLYTFDVSQNATFPAAITSTKFVKSGGTSAQFLKADGSVDSNTYAKSGHTHTKSQITDFPTSLPANGGYADAIASKGMLDSQEKIDNFITANRFEYALFNTTDANNVDFAGNDGMILSIPWTSTTYGFQMAFDDTHAGTVKVRGKSNSWGDWYTLLHSGNYTTYTVKKDGTGASGTWGISVTGSAGSVAWGNVTGKPSSFTPSSHTHSYTTIESCTTLDINSDNFSAEYAVGSNSVTTKPNGVDAFGVIKLKTASGWYGQILLSSNTAQGLYYRTSTSLSSSVSWKKLLDSSNYNSYAPKLDGTGATGTWKINISGNAKTATNIDWNGITNKPTSFEPSSHNHSFTLGATTITTGGTCTAITGPFAVNTAASADKAFAINRNSAIEGVKHWVDDSTYHIEYTNDENVSSIAIRLINTDTERATDKGANATDVTVYLDSYRNFHPNVNNTGSIGISSYKWANMYATTFHGSLDGKATYASNVGSSGTAGTNYVTASKVISACNWYDTMIGSDSDTIINRWSEIVAFVAGFKETPDLATFLNNNYLAKAGGTMTGPLKWKDNNALPQQTSPQYFLCIDAFDAGGTTKWTSKADTLKALTGLTATAIGDSDEPVYWNGSKFVKAGAYPTKSSWNYDDRYLKLSGGTLTGTLTINTASDSSLILDEPSGEKYHIISFRANGEEYARLCSNYLNSENNLLFNGNVIYHSGNLPAYPTVNNGALHLQANGTTKVTFNANQSSNSTFNIATGSANGTISVAGIDVAVKGLGSNAYTSTAYLPLAGGTMDANAQIKRAGRSGSWVGGRDRAIIRETSSSGYHPLFSLKTKDGSWELGEYNTSELYNVPIFAYVTDTDYSNGNNTTTYQIKYPLASGTIALTSDLTWSNISSKPETATRWPSWSEVTNKPSTFPVSEHNHDGRYLKLSGGTLTGVLHLLGSQYTDSANTGALDLGNSDIYGVNSIKFSDLSDSAGEGLQWYRDATHVDSLWVNNGVIYFSPNRTWGGSVTNYTVWHTGNDGSGSGLDADLLDGKHASDFSLSTHTHDYIAKLRRLNEVFGYSSFASGMFPPALFELKTAGYPVYSDPEFMSGYNSISVYNNYGNKTVTITREQAGDHANSSGFQLKITTAGEATPGCGGFYQGINSRANAIFVQIFRAKIPVGYNVATASNSMGTNYQDRFITDRAGTGKWEWYARVVYCGASGSFSSGGHVYLSANSGYSATSVTWYLSYCNLIDITKGAYDGLRTRFADSADNVIWSNVTEKPTTIGGYGITDALKIDGSNGTAAGVSTLINKLDAGSSTPKDADYYVCQYAGGGITNTTYFRRPMSAMWNWIKAKTDTLYPTKSGSGATGTWGINVTGSAKYLASNASKNIGGLSYYYIGGSTFNTTVDGSWSGYSAATNYNSIVRLQSHTGSAKYYIDLIFDVNNSEIYYRRVTNNSLANIRKIDVYEVPESTASYSLSNAAWTNTITLPTTAGSYILNIVSGNSTLTGVFSIGASDNAKDEISLHLHGNGPRLYARTNGTTLQLSSNDASATSRSVTIKYRRMI